MSIIASCSANQSGSSQMGSTLPRMAILARLLCRARSRPPRSSRPAYSQAWSDAR
jgi:hypothetical protein